MDWEYSWLSYSIFFARNMPPVLVLQDGIIVHGQAMKRMREHSVTWLSQVVT